MDPTNGFIRTLYRPDSDDNVIFTTERCNSNCLVCSQPPRDDDDVDAPPPRNLELIRILNIPPNRLLQRVGSQRCWATVSKGKFPKTNLQMPTNARIFAWTGFTSRLAELGTRT